MRNVTNWNISDLSVLTNWSSPRQSICSVLPEINSDASGAATPWHTHPHQPLSQDAIMASEISGVWPPLSHSKEMSTSCPSLCGRLSSNESFSRWHLRLWPICFPSLLKSGRLNEAASLGVQGELRVTPRVIELLSCGLHLLTVIWNVRIKSFYSSV